MKRQPTLDTTFPEWLELNLAGDVASAAALPAYRELFARHFVNTVR